MLTAIAIILGLIAAYCGVNWLLIFYNHMTGQYLHSEFDRINTAAFYLGLCAILSLGFMGMILK